ncbi:MAG TPA: glycosyltransferase 87 family protein [Chloroflexota bacterium]
MSVSGYSHALSARCSRHILARLCARSSGTRRHQGPLSAFDLATCAALALLLHARGSDPRLAILYAWCPLPIVEFAIEGHLDSVAITFMVLAVLSATDARSGARSRTGFLLAVATLIRLYPVLLLLLLLRRRDWPLALTFLVTLVVGYLPFIVLGHGRVSGSLLTYASAQGGNAGIVQAVVRRVSAGADISPGATLRLEFLVDILLLLTVVALVVLLRRRGAIGIELAILLLFGSIFVLSSHIFPWYVTTVLPWVALSIRPLGPNRWSSVQTVATATAWYVACTALFGYMDNAVGVKTAPWWAKLFYLQHGLVVIPAMIGVILLVFACLSVPTLRQPRSWIKAASGPEAWRQSGT